MYASIKSTVIKLTIYIYIMLQDNDEVRIDNFKLGFQGWLKTRHDCYFHNVNKLANFGTQIVFGNSVLKHLLCFTCVTLVTILTIYFINTSFFFTFCRFNAIVSQL